MDKNTIRFSRRDSAQFFRTLNKRVNEYFKENNLKKTGNWKLHLKTIVMFAIFLTPYFLILTLNLPFWGYLLLSITMGVGMAGVGMNVMHDGNHGAYSNKKWVNKLMGSSIYILAGNVYNWQVQHNVLHHTYTNIHEHDEDMEAGRILRFSKHAEWRKHHKFQHYYSILLYGLLTFNWAITTDFQQMYRYMKRKLSYGKLPNPVINWSTLVITKVIYITIWIVLPLIFVDIAWWQVLLGFFIMHYVAGVILSVVFQLAHIVDHAETPLPDEEGNMKNTWAIHQLFTTVNFGTKNRIVNWFTGGLNHQVEHHIFPNISHIHYTNISKIVKQTAQEFNLPYHEYKTTRKAIISHFKHLKELGKKPTLQYQ
ncbi:Linoleoyl-CoA desaturase [Allomuricauda ruestringensis DSM 13258]|uniref:Linoleoyl-CoA desaturase n=1 Tax=Allomuricauda ruestringensis (strain DSM 13258 / CIP 107369 / LMG 19739 / B1) TaxID=886377 RepID=G2PL58_ALLRU|nr:acyl-CoA desaturase [Allomuricauda ruestringensis]AEM71087.1 Linoleoyl-CoA desaturase [Allomuricauda ruestringensis DSM 13258]